MEDCIGQFVAVRGTGSVSWRMALWDCFKDVIASLLSFATKEMRGKLDRVNFRKDFWDCDEGKVARTQ